MGFAGQWERRLIKKGTGRRWGHFGRAKRGWVEVSLTWDEGRLATAEVQHLVAAHEAEIVPLISPRERLHYQVVDTAEFPRLKACGCLLVPLEGGAVQGRDEDDEV